MKRIILLIVLFLLLAGGIAGYVWIHGITRKIFVPRGQDAASNTPVNTIQKHLDDKTPIDFVLLGYGGGNHDGAYLTDSIITVRIDPKQKKIFMLSIPRDLYIKIPTNGLDGNYSKINAAYEIGLDDTNYPGKQKQFTGSDGGGKMAEYIFSKVTGLPVSYFVGMDFSGFKNTIDTLGGVDLNVEKTFDDYQYPIEGNEDAPCGHTNQEIQDFTASPSADESVFFPCRFEHLHFDAGQQHLDGTRALKYVRSRHSLQDGTDFGRAKRQRNLIVAVKQKIITPAFIPKIIPFMTSLGDDLRTDMSLDDVKVLVQNANVLNKYQIVNLALTDQNYLSDVVTSGGQDVLEPKGGIDNWDEIHAYIASELSGIPIPVPAIVKIENGTKTPGLAGSAADNLKAGNIQTVEPANAQDQTAKITTITAYDKNISTKDIQAIENEFGTSKITYSNAAQPGYNVLVVLGTDYIKPTTTP